MSQSITIDGSNHTIVIDGRSISDIFDVASNTVFTLNNLTIQNGNNPQSQGGAIYNQGNLTINRSSLINNTASANKTTLYGDGGAIYNTVNGSVVINASQLSGNLASGSGAYTARGGGVFNLGTLSINMSTLSNNINADSIYPGPGGEGGAIYNENSGIAVVNASTLSNNTVLFGNGGAIYTLGTFTLINSTLYGNTTGPSTHGYTNNGGAIYGGGLTVVSSTLFNNHAYNGEGGGIYVTSPALTLLSSIIANNSGNSVPDVMGSANSLGHNLIGFGDGLSLTAINGATGDQVGTFYNRIDPKLATLANNGGLTQTLALLPGSPAIGHGDCNGSSSVNPPIAPVTADQRGVIRNLKCDIGAYESTFSFVTDTPTNSPNTSTPTATNTSTATLSPTSTSVSNTSTPTPGKIDTIGVYRSGLFYLRLQNTSGFADFSALFNPPGQNLPIVGDWTGAGFDSIGVYDQSAGIFSVRNNNTTGLPDQQFVLGSPNDTPLAGRWVSNAIHVGAGVYRPSNGILYVKNTLSSGYADHAMILGIAGDQGITGDWTGKGYQSVGVYRTPLGRFFLSNQITDGLIYADLSFGFGIGEPFTGDWIGHGVQSVGLFAPSNGTMYLRGGASDGIKDGIVIYGIPGDVPVAGHWQAVYPPKKPIQHELILGIKTAVPYVTPDVSHSNSVPGGNQIGG